MNVTFEFNSADDCCYVTVSGPIHTNDVRESFDAAWARPEYVGASRALWDFTGARIRLSPEEKAAMKAALQAGRDAARSLADASTRAAQDLAYYAREGRPDQLPGKVALIAASDLDLGMMRMYIGHTAFEDFEARVFKSSDRARDWLFGEG